jgi:hypothetical protein
MADDERAWLVDWGWAVRGPAWIDPMLWGLRLVIDGGQTMAQSAAWVRRLKGFATADDAALRVFSRAEARSWQYEFEQGAVRTDDLKAVQSWASFRD